MGGQELTMPVVHPAELWPQPAAATTPTRPCSPSRTAPAGTVLAMTHEESVVDLSESEVRAYHHMPQ